MHLLAPWRTLIMGGLPCCRRSNQNRAVAPFFPYLEKDQVSKIADVVACMAAIVNLSVHLPKTKDYQQ